MKQEEFIVTSRGEGMQDALAATEKLGADSGLNKKENLRLRLLAEELFGMVRSIVGELEARYWIEHEGKSFDMHLSSEVELTQEMRKALISVSSQGENAAARGFMGKLRDMIAAALLPKETRPLLSDLSLGFMGLASNSSPYAQQAAADAFRWSMSQYKDIVSSELSENEDSRAEWDELEKSIVANIADEIVVSVVGSAVEITISKAF